MDRRASRGELVDRDPHAPPMAEPCQRLVDEAVLAPGEADAQVLGSAVRL